MNRTLSFRIVALLLLASAVISCAGSRSGSPVPDAALSGSPASASYLFENKRIQLQNGHIEWQAAPGSSSMIKVAILGEVISGDLTDDTIEDAVLFLTYQGGGSGTFYYVGAALAEHGQYRGTNTLLLGDRISSPVARVQNGLISVTYFDRRPEEAMAAVPSQEQTRYFIAADSVLREIRPAAEEGLHQGWLTIGHEVRSFLPCNEKKTLWLHGSSPALDQIIAGYEKTMAGRPPYAPVFSILAGRTVPAPAEGFGADFQKAFSASALVHIRREGNCRSDFIRLDSPVPGARISSPLTIKGKARGLWFFEGDFPVMLLDAQGEKIAESYVSAKEEWMTKNFVRFEGILHFKNSFSGTQGTLVLKKDNPTGLITFDDALEIPINFK